MQIHFDSTKIDPELPGVIILSHGPLAMGLIESSRLFSDDLRNVAAFSLENQDNPEMYMNEVFKVADAFPADPIFLVDLMGGSPANQLISCSLKCGEQPLAVAGANLPILIELLNLRHDMRGRELFDVIAGIAESTIVNITERMEQI